MNGQSSAGRLAPGAGEDRVQRLAIAHREVRELRHEPSVALVAGTGDFGPLRSRIPLYSPLWNW